MALDQVSIGCPRPTTVTKGLDCWVAHLGEVVDFGVEGAGSYGAGLIRHLTSCVRTVIEVNRPERSTRRRLGKSDSLDAEMAARAVLARVAKDYPKSGLGMSLLKAGFGFEA